MYGKIIVGINLLVVFGIAIWKWVKIDDMITSTTDHIVFKKEIAFYESLGFSLYYNATLLENDGIPGATYTFKSNMLDSFNLEIFMTILMILVLIYFIKAEKRYKFLTDCENQEDIEEYVKLNNAQFDDEEEVVEKKIDIGSKKVLN